MSIPLKVGITGGIGSGKSFVCRIIEACGYPVFYADAISKKIVNSDEQLLRELSQLTATQLQLPDGTLDRKKLASLIFSDAKLREQVNEVIHPYVRRAFDQWSEQQHTPIVFKEAAITFETGGHKLLDCTVLVTAPEELRISRVRARDEVTESEVRARMSSQMPDEEKIPLADFVIVNDGIRPLLIQVEQLLAALEKKS